MSPESPPSSLDQMLEELEKLVVCLETGELSLEQSMSTFQKGCDIVQHCQKVLDDTEKKIKILDEQIQELRAPHDREIDS